MCFENLRGPPSPHHQPSSQEVGGAFSSLSNEVVDVPKVVETTEQVKKAIDPHEQEVSWRKKSFVVIMGNKFVYT